MKRRFLALTLALLTFFSSVSPAFATAITDEDDVVSFTPDDFAWLEEQGIGGYSFENGEISYYDLDGNKINQKKGRSSIALASTTFLASAALSVLGITFSKSASLENITNAINDMFIEVPKVLDMFTLLSASTTNPILTARFTKRFLADFYSLVKDYFSFDTPAIETFPEQDKPFVEGSQAAGTGINIAIRPTGISYSSFKHQRYFSTSYAYRKVLDITINSMFSAGRFTGYKASQMIYELDSAYLVIKKIPSSASVFFNGETYPVEPQFYLRLYTSGNTSYTYGGHLNDEYLGSLTTFPQNNFNPRNYRDVYKINTLKVPYNSSAVTGGTGTSVTVEDVLDAWGTVAGGDDVALELPITGADGLVLPQVNTLPQSILDALAAIANPPTHPDIDNPDKPSVPPLGFFPDVLNGLKDILKGLLDIPKALFEGLKAFFENIFNLLKQLFDLLTKFFDISLVETKTLNMDGMKNLVVFDRFPFCIPFDFIRSFGSLAATPKDFTFDIDINTSFFKLDHAVNLAPFMVYFSIFRYACLTFFVFALMMKTKDMIKW